MDRFTGSRARVLSAAGAAALAAALLASCAPDRTVPPCPDVRVDSATANVTQFREGPGREVGDIVYQAEIVRYEGSCTQDLENDEGEAEVEMEVEFALATGAAAPAGEIPLYYFVAIPQLFPDPAAKQVFEVRRDSRGGASKVDRWTETISLTLPVTKARPSAAYDIYVGFQLTDEQLAFNRTRIR
ncbi:MAG: hypothetical protein AB7E79_08030 [Rhodospirillaceae bacterium]